MKVLDVAVAILRDGQGRVLINKRIGDAMHQGHWEFPGGKFEAGESPEQALIRECEEELGVVVKSSTELLTLTHQYPTKRVQLFVREVQEYEGIPQSLEGQPLKWVYVKELSNQNLLPADVVIVEALQSSV